MAKGIKKKSKCIVLSCVMLCCAKPVWFGTSDLMGCVETKWETSYSFRPLKRLSGKRDIRFDRLNVFPTKVRGKLSPTVKLGLAIIFSYLCHAI